MSRFKIDLFVGRGAGRLSRCGLAALLVTGLAAAAAPLAAEQGAKPPPASSAEESGQDPARELKDLKRLLEQIRELSGEQIRQLEQRIADLEAQLRELQATEQSDELAELLAEAEALTAEEVEQEKEAEEQREQFTGRQRTLQALNPEISFLGDVSYDWTSGEIKDGFVLRSAELGFQAPLDPYTRFKAFLGAHSDPFSLDIEEPVTELPVARQAGEEDSHDHGTELNLAVGEAYMEWVALPTNMKVYLGKFRQQYGTLNRWHLHSLPSVESPFALRNTFGGHGLVGLGLGLNWELPRLWASSNGLTLEVVNASNPHAFAGSDWNDPSFLLRHTGFFDLGPDAYLELGLNATRGPNDQTGNTHTTVSGVDVNFLWEPVNRAKYRNVELRGEWIHTGFEREEASTVRSDSFYVYLSSRFSRRWIVGLRYDNAELPFDRFELYQADTLEPLPFTEGLREEGWTPFLTWWQSPWVRLRLQYQHASRDFVASWGEADDDKVWLQVTFAAGPHKHESY
jgi:hypothetical protein